MKAINLVFVFILFAGTILGQPELKPGQHKGYILTKDGKQDVITSYSIHYTKLYDTIRRPQALWSSGKLSGPWTLCPTFARTDYHDGKPHHHTPGIHGVVTSRRGKFLSSYNFV